EISKRESQNLFFSPLSAETVLAFVQSGCKDATAQEIRIALHLPDDKEKVDIGVKNFLPPLKINTNYTLLSANKVYIKDVFEIKEDFKTTAIEVYHADLENINFSKNAEAAQIINKWVEEQTNSKIQNLIASCELTNETRAIIINTLYFKANWVYRFLLRYTAKRDFYKCASDILQVDTMFMPSRSKCFFNYSECEKLNAQFLELPFKGEGASMVIVLPKEKEGLATLENEIESVFSPRQFYRTLVDITLYSAKPFDDKKADLSVIAGDKGDLVINNVIQKTFIDVNEDGVEAAAVSGVNKCSG
ncbi:Serpin domain containing protein, partial [Asbolus verrucosus]